MARLHGAPDGFEGNAQSFRVITKLAEHKPEFEGLNLTRATLNALLKYPWSRGTEGITSKKWNYYKTEEEDFTFARRPNELHTSRMSAEAALMDWADDIAYSVHDIIDFYQAGMIPLDRLSREDDDEIGDFLKGVKTAWERYKLHQDDNFEEYKAAFVELTPFLSVSRPYAGYSEQRYALKKLCSFLIERYSRAVTLQVPANDAEPFLKITPRLRTEVTMLKELTWHYVIREPALASQQEGQEVIIESLFETYWNACEDRRRWRFFPPRLRDIAEKDEVDDSDNKTKRCRLVCDIIASMSEQQAQAMYRRFKGISTESAFMMIFR